MDGLSGSDETAYDRAYRERKSIVQSLDETRAFPTIAEVSGVQYSDEATVDKLFGKAPHSYQAIKKERPQHRVILWATINGHKTEEVAALVGLTKQQVSVIKGQPWFRDAFVRITTEMGTDMFKKTLEGEAVPALQRVAELSKTAESEAVRLAANKEILDRFLGKATVKVEQKGTIQVDHAIHDAAKLVDEDAKLSEQLRARGLN